MSLEEKTGESKCKRKYLFSYYLKEEEGKI
jgi:hypothetical protein